MKKIKSLKDYKIGNLYKEVFKSSGFIIYKCHKIFKKTAHFRIFGASERDREFFNIGDNLVNDDKYQDYSDIYLYNSIENDFNDWLAK